MSETTSDLMKTLEDMLTRGKIPYKEQGGRLRVRKGSSAVFIKPSDWTGSHRLIEMISPVLTRIDRSEALLVRLNDINMGLYFGKTYWHENTVWIAHNLLADDLAPEELFSAVGLVVSVADNLDDELKKQFGGVRWVDS